MSPSKTLLKIAQYLKISYGDVFGWITPSGLLESHKSQNKEFLTHSSIVRENQNLIPNFDPDKDPYIQAFKNNWVRWVITRSEIDFEGMERGLKRQEDQIKRIIERFYQPNRSTIIIETEDTGRSLQFEYDSQAMKAFQKAGIYGLLNYFREDSPIRKFL